MSLFRAALQLSAFALVAHAASAATIVDTNDYVTPQSPNGQYISWNPFTPFSDSFNLLDHGYVPAMTVTSATVTFWFNDNEGDGRTGLLLDPVVVDLGEFDLLGDLGHWDVDFGTVVGDTYVSGSILADVQDGILSFRVHGVAADFYLTKAELSAEVPSASVPDGGVTAMLLGLALTGTALVRRRVRS